MVPTIWTPRLQRHRMMTDGRACVFGLPMAARDSAGNYNDNLARRTRTADNITAVCAYIYTYLRVCSGCDKERRKRRQRDGKGGGETDRENRGVEND